MKDSPSLVALPDYRKLNMALYEFSSIEISLRFTVFGDTAWRLMKAPMMMQKLFLLMMLSSRAS